MNSYKNVGVQTKGNLHLFVLNSPQTMVDSVSSENGESFAKVNRKAKASMNISSKYIVDSLVEQTVSSLGSASFVYNSTSNVVEHRFLRVARTLDIEENAYYVAKKE